MPTAILPTSFHAVDTRALLAHLTPNHPRFILTQDRIAQTHQHILNHPTAQKLFADLTAYCDELLPQPPLTSDDHAASRLIADRVLSLALLYHLTQNQAYARRAADELLASSRLPSWRPDEFLGLAERALTFALGLDWLDSHLSPAERTQIENALLANALLPAREAYATLPWWHRDSCNWNIVCNSAIILASLALAHRDPPLAAHLIATALAGLPNALATFAPDGGWPEGPGYWAFATRYLTLLQDSLDTAFPPPSASVPHCLSASSSPLSPQHSVLSTSFPTPTQSSALSPQSLSSLPGLSQAALFRLHTEGPTHLLYNFADSYVAAHADPSLFSLARRYHIPAAAFFTRRNLDLGHTPIYLAPIARALLNFTPIGSPQDLDQLPLDAHFTAHDIATFRSSFSDPRATFLACKGGDIQSPHAHADLGSFILDAKSHRFLLDLGPDHYDLPNFWLGRPNTTMLRWSLLRTSTAGHNTLLIHPRNPPHTLAQESPGTAIPGSPSPAPNSLPITPPSIEQKIPPGSQHPLATAPITRFLSTPDEATCTIDLTAAYAHAGLAHAARTFTFNRKNQTITITDNLHPATETPIAIAAHYHTTAAITLAGNTATLSIESETITLTFSAPTPFTLTTEELTAAPNAKPLENTRRLIFHTSLTAPAKIQLTINCN